jgi:hypothetical protein
LASIRARSASMFVRTASSRLAFLQLGRSLLRLQAARRRANTCPDLSVARTTPVLPRLDSNLVFAAVEEGRWHVWPPAWLRISRGAMWVMPIDCTEHENPSSQRAQRP